MQQRKSNVCNKPFIMQWGVVLLQVSSAMQVLVEDNDIVYPESQVNVATDRYVVPFTYVIFPFSGFVRVPQSIMSKYTL